VLSAASASAAAAAVSAARAAPPLRVTVDEPCCGIGGARSAARYLNSRKRARPAGDDDFFVVSAHDADERRRAKTKLYNATAWRGEVVARSLRVESASAHADARRISPLLTVCGLPCWDLSVLGRGDGVLDGPTAAAFAGFFARLAATRSPLLIIEEVDALLFASNVESFRFITRNLQRLGYHWRVRVLDAAKLGAPQRRLRCYIICARDAGVLGAFSWPSPTHKRRASTLAEAMLPVNHAPRSLFLNRTTQVARALSRPPPEGLARPSCGAVYSRVASVYGDRVHVLSSSRACVATITASRSSGLYVWEGDALRRLAGIEALRLFTFSEVESAEFAAAAEALGLASVELAEMAGDSFVVVVVAQLMRSLVDAFRSASSEATVAPWVA
jgi:site-specific DNA-cytosine methylase